MTWAAEREQAYGTSRPEVLRVLPAFAGPVLDVGCATGALGAAIKARYPDVKVWGIEVEPEAADRAKEVLDEVLIGNVTALLPRLLDDGFRPDLILFADVLEHLHDPWRTYDQAVQLVRPGGHIVVSLPNVAHWDTFWNLMRGRWPYRLRGIHDDTHLRFFARKNVEELTRRGNSHLVRLERVLRLVERPHPINRFAPYLCRLFPGPFTFQYLAVARILYERQSLGE